MKTVESKLWNASTACIPKILEREIQSHQSLRASLSTHRYGHIVYRVIAKGITLHQTPHRKNDEKIGKKKSQIMCDLQVDDDTGRTSEKARRLAQKPFE